MATSRRRFLQLMGAGVAIAATRRAAADAPKKPASAPKEGDFKLPAGGRMPTRRLGRIGEKVSLMGLGGYHIGSVSDEKESARLIHGAIDHGVTFLDNCWDYHDGKSEEWMGKALQGGYRKKVFLMSKIDGRTRDAAMQQIEQSLKRLRTDTIDLMQIHEVIRASDPERCFAKNAVMEALVEAKKQGKIRYIGFTGHKDPDFHVKMFEAGLKSGFTFDAVQMPLNVMDAHYKSFAKKVVPLLQKHDVAILGMKPMGSGIILQSGAVTATECLHYAMHLPTSVVITGCDGMGVLEQGLHAAYTFKPLEEKAVSTLLARTAPFGADGRFEKFKTSGMFDGTEQHPHWLDSAKL